MRPFEWKPEYSVSVSRFDREHKRLLELAETLHDALYQGNERATLQKALGDLITHATRHFNGEEELLAEHGYPELEHHRFEHAQLSRKVSDFQRQFSAGETPMTFDFVEFVQRWVINHVLQTDTRYGDFLNDLGVY